MTSVPFASAESCGYALRVSTISFALCATRPQSMLEWRAATTTQSAPDSCSSLSSTLV